jgi:hypothetical protein
MSKSQLIDEIQQINRSAGRDWLVLFDIAALRSYLDHLQVAIEPRGGSSVWVRRAETPAIITHVPAA